MGFSAMFTNRFAKIFEKPAYWRYWLAYTLSTVGFELISFALMVVLFNLMKTALSMGTFTAIFMFCMVVSGPFAGIYIDRWDRKRIFIVCNILLAVSIFALKYLSDPIWIYLLWFLASTVYVFLRPVRVALITNLFPAKDYFQANSAFVMSLNLSKVLGPLIGGALLTFFSKDGTMNTILSFFLLACILISTLSFRSPSSKGAKGRPSKWNLLQLTTGIRFLLSHEQLRFYVFIGFLWRLFLACQLPLYIVFVMKYIGGSTPEYSLFMTILALGGALGSLLAGGIEHLWSRKKMIYGGLGASYLLFAVLPIFHNFVAALILIGLSNLSFYIAHVAMHSHIQRITPDEIRGKVFASSPTLLLPVGVVSMLIATPLADKVGVHWIFFISGFLALITLPWVGHVSRLVTKGFEAKQCGDLRYDDHRRAEEA
jgi:DHA3 family macrolide efflux protein-like MFS transporter